MYMLNKKHKVCRRYFEDVFGNLLLKETKSLQVLLFYVQYKKKKVYKPFLFVITQQPKHIIKPRLSKAGDLLEHRKKLSYFYGGLRKKGYKKLIKISSKKGNFLSNIINNFELSLPSLLYRMNFCVSMKEAMYLVQAGVVSVNKEVQKNLGFCANIGDIIQILPFNRRSNYLKVVNKVNQNKCLILDNLYCVVNYETMSCIIYKKVESSEVYYPFAFSASKLVGSFFGKH